jgi:ABC-type phosphate transport system permease subunit
MSIKETIKQNILLVCSGAIVVLFIAVICMTVNLALEIYDSPINMTMVEALNNATAQGVPPIMAKTFLAGLFLIIVKYVVIGSIIGINIAVFIKEIGKRLEASSKLKKKRESAIERTRRWREKQRK